MYAVQVQILLVAYPRESVRRKFSAGNLWTRRCMQTPNVQLHNTHTHTLQSRTGIKLFIVTA